MVDHSGARLGRSGLRVDEKRRAIAASLFPKLPPPPDVVDWSCGKTDWGMMGNDRLGDCVFAGAAHFIQVATLATTQIVTPPDDQIIQMYEKWAGYNPADPSTDQGYIEADFLDHWLKEGYCGQNLIAHISTDPKNLDHVKKSVNFFGPAYMGVVLPISAQTQAVWDVVDHDGGVWGGHCMIVVSYDSFGPTFITWGGLKRATWAWWEKYVDESHSLLLEAWTLRYPSISNKILVGILQAVQ